MAKENYTGDDFVSPTIPYSISIWVDTGSGVKQAHVVADLIYDYGDSRPLYPSASDWLKDYRHGERKSAGHRGNSPASTATNRNTVSKNGFPLPNYPDPPEVGLNELYWPTGATRWGYGRFLVNLDFFGKPSGTIPGRGFLGGVSELAEPGPRATIQWETPIGSDSWKGGQNLLADIGVGPGYPQLIPMYVKSLERLTPVSGQGGDPGNKSTDQYGSLAILELVDERYYWQDIPYVFNPDNTETGHLAAPGEGYAPHYGWEYVLDAINESIARTLGTSFWITHQPNSPKEKNWGLPDPAEFLRNNDSVATVLEAYCQSTGSRFVYDCNGLPEVWSFDEAVTWKSGISTVGKPDKCLLRAPTPTGPNAAVKKEGKEDSASASGYRPDNLLAVGDTKGAVGVPQFCRVVFPTSNILPVDQSQTYQIDVELEGYYSGMPEGTRDFTYEQTGAIRKYELYPKIVFGTTRVIHSSAFADFHTNPEEELEEGEKAATELKPHNEDDLKKLATAIATSLARQLTYHYDQTVWAIIPRMFQTDDAILIGFGCPSNREKKITSTPRSGHKLIAYTRFWSHDSNFGCDYIFQATRKEIERQPMRIIRGELSREDISQSPSQGAKENILAPKYSSYDPEGGERGRGAWRDYSTAMMLPVDKYEGLNAKNPLRSGPDNAAWVADSDKKVEVQSAFDNACVILDQYGYWPEQFYVAAPEAPTTPYKKRMKLDDKGEETDEELMIGKGRFEILGEVGLFRKARCTTSSDDEPNGVAPGEHGKFTVFSGTRLSKLELTHCVNMTGSAIKENQDCLVRYIPDQKQWFVVGGEGSQCAKFQVLTTSEIDDINYKMDSDDEGGPINLGGKKNLFQEEKKRTSNIYGAVWVKFLNFAVTGNSLSQDNKVSYGQVWDTSTLFWNNSEGCAGVCVWSQDHSIYEGYNQPRDNVPRWTVVEMFTVAGFVQHKIDPEKEAYNYEILLPDDRPLYWGSQQDILEPRGIDEALRPTPVDGKKPETYTNPMELQMGGNTKFFATFDTVAQKYVIIACNYVFGLVADVPGQDHPLYVDQGDLIEIAGEEPKWRKKGDFTGDVIETRTEGPDRLVIEHTLPNESFGNTAQNALNLNAIIDAAEVEILIFCPAPDGNCEDPEEGRCDVELCIDAKKRRDDAQAALDSLPGQVITGLDTKKGHVFEVTLGVNDGLSYSWKVCDQEQTEATINKGDMLCFIGLVEPPPPDEYLYTTLDAAALNMGIVLDWPLAPQWTEQTQIWRHKNGDTPFWEVRQLYWDIATEKDESVVFVGWNDDGWGAGKLKFTVADPHADNVPKDFLSYKIKHEGDGTQIEIKADFTAINGWRGTKNQFLGHRTDGKVAWIDAVTCIEP